MQHTETERLPLLRVCEPGVFLWGNRNNWTISVIIKPAAFLLISALLEYLWAELSTCERVGSPLSPVLHFDIGNRAFDLLWALELLFFLCLGFQGFYTKLQLAGVLLMLHKETEKKHDVRNLLSTITTDVTVLWQTCRVYGIVLQNTIICVSTGWN